VFLTPERKDRYIRVFDPRKKGSISKTLGLEGQKGQRIVWFSDLNKFGAVGFTKTNSRGYSIWDMKKMDTPLGAADIDTGAGAFIPYYDADNSILFLAGKGDAAVRYWEVTNDEPFVHFLSEFRDTESTKGACFLPKGSCDVTKCEVAVCYRLMKDWVSPVSFTVPRKSELFQADLFPDTYAGIPVLTADEWIAGQNKAPLKKSMKPGSTGPAGGVSNDSKFSNDSKSSTGPAPSAPAVSGGGSAEAQLQAALARIKELEAEVQTLKAKGN